MTAVVPTAVLLAHGSLCKFLMVEVAQPRMQCPSFLQASCRLHSEEMRVLTSLGHLCNT